MSVAEGDLGRSESWTAVRGMILTPAGEGKYRRIGFSVQLDSKLLDGCEKKLFTII